MGRIKTKFVKTISKQLLEKYPSKFNKDFDNNKKALDEINILDEKKMRNKIAGTIVKTIKKKRF